MIIVNNLTKIYKTKNRKSNIALNNVSFKLPDKGLVFIIGKSGSGKSTLLNMIGGLDDYDSGQIIADGYRFSEFSAEDFVKYRSSYIGFVFQHYNLLDEMTVKQNIELTLDISGISDNNIVSDVLAQVDLSGYENRYPTELSGGQRQRVAIARALAKNPMLLLGDEPTGNLDNKTSKLIMELLKKISKDKLVVIVSHDLKSADQYADRIIELHDGKIIYDKEKRTDYENKFNVNDDTIQFPYLKDLNQEEQKKLLFALKLKRYKKIEQLDNGFSNTNEVIGSDKKVKLTSNKISFKNIIKLGKVFLNKRIKSSIGIMLVSTLIFAMISVIQSFIQFDPNIYDVDASQTVVLKKFDQIPFSDSIYSSSLYELTDYEYEKIMFEKEEGNIYKLYNYSYSTGASNIIKTIFGMTTDLARMYGSFYSSEIMGTLNCSEEYLNKIYGQDGKIKLLAGSLYEYDCGIIITDYTADSLLIKASKYFKQYEDIIGELKIGNAQYCYISGIIDTGYKSRHSELIEIYASSSDPTMVYDTVKKKDSYINFINEVTSHLSIGYNLNPNFEEDLKNTVVSQVIGTCNLNISKGDEMLEIDGSKIFHYRKAPSSLSLNDNEIAMGYSLYNSLFGTSYNTTNLDEFIPHEITLTKYHDSEKKEIDYSKTYEIKELTINSMIYFNDSQFLKMQNESIYNYGLYLDEVSNAEEIARLAGQFNMHTNNLDHDNILVINKMNQALIPFLRLILLLLFFFEFFYLVNFGINNIRKNLFEIGVIKSLGGKTRDIGIIFISNVIFSGIAICILSVVLGPIIIRIANRMLVNSFATILSLTIYDLQIVRVIPVLVGINILFTLFVTLISAILSLVSLYRVKPIEIINSQE